MAELHGFSAREMPEVFENRSVLQWGRGGVFDGRARKL